MKTALKRLTMAILVALAALQIPFIYRRAGFSKLAQKVAELKAVSAASVRQPDGFSEYLGVFHVHSSLGGHSNGSFEELVTAANDTGLDFVIMTEHWSGIVDTAALSPDGPHGRTLFVAGNEVDTAYESDRLLTVPGDPNDGLRNLDTHNLIRTIRSEDRLAVVPYPERFGSWDSDFDGIEVFSLHTNAQEVSRLTAVLDILWSFPSYPEQVLMHYFARPDENLKKFDEVAARRRVSLTAGADAHSNIGVHLFGDDAGNKLFSFKLDEYSTIFRLVRQHILLPAGEEFDREALLRALRGGHSFIGLDAIADTKGFRFGTPDGRLTMGDETTFSAVTPIQLRASVPIPGRLVVYRNGELFLETDRSHQIEMEPTSPGAYRVEVYLDELGPPFDKMPWIISNPIFVRPGD